MAQEVDFHALKRLLADPNNFVLDVRELQEVRNDGGIPGSVNIPLAVLESLSGSVDDLKKTIGRPLDTSGGNIILSCRSGRRAFLALEMMKLLGFDEAKVYRGSFSDWKARGGEVVTEASGVGM